MERNRHREASPQKRPVLGSVSSVYVAWMRIWIEGTGIGL